MITLAIVENSLKHLDIIEQHLQKNKQYKIVTTATNGFDFAAYCLQAKTLPDIALIDIQMNIMDGIALTDFLQQFFPSIKCIGVTSYCNKEVITDMVSCGAMGMVFKLFTMKDEILFKEYIPIKFNGLDSSITAVANNEFYLDSYMQLTLKETLPLFDREAMRAHRLQQIQANAALNFTDREKIIVALCASSSTKLDVIAQALCVDIKTLEKTLTQIYKKLSIDSRLELTHFCISRAIIFNSRNTA